MSAENAWRIAMEAAAPATPGFRFADVYAEAIRALPMPPAFRAAVEAETEELRGMLAEARLALLGMLAHSCVADAGSDMKDEEDHAAERLARALLSRLEAKGESHE